MHNKRQFINAVCILFSLCFIGCINKKTQTAELEKAEVSNTQEIELHSESNELQEDETDNFQGEYIFSSYDSLEYKNIDDVGKYVELDETTYIRMIRKSKGIYVAESNYWFIEERVKGIVFKYPDELRNQFNYDERFKDRFYQYTADGMHGGIYVDFFYTGTGIVLHCIEWNNRNEVDDPNEERVKYYLYFNKKNNESRSESNEF
jgi:hypothetical protein